jgi:hypothetical protein
MCDNNVDDNQPTSPDNLGNLGKLREDLGNTYPEVETIENKGVENNLGNLGKGIPNLPRKEAESLKTGEEWSEPSLEGGYVPEVSRAYPQESCDVEPVGGTDLGNNLGKPFPNFPEVPEVCDSSAQVVTVIEDAIAPIPVEQVDSTSADDSEEVITSQPQRTWAWSRKTGECLGQVLHDGGNRLKIRRSGEPASRAKWHERNQITFENPTVSALSLNTSPTTPAQWEDDQQFLEEFDD